MKIIDNFLTQQEHRAIKDILLGRTFPWFYRDHKISNEVIEHRYDAQFVHMFYDRPNSSSSMTILSAIMKKLGNIELIRIKANLTTCTPDKLIYGFHIDTQEHDAITAIYYVNTTNGPTMFYDGTSVDCLENRMVLFDHKAIHSGISCTDSKSRCVVNLNFKIPGPTPVIQ